jgi:hypothetical protein
MKSIRTLAAMLAAAFSLAAQIPDFTPPTPLLGAVLRNDAAEVKRLLASGADPNEGRFLGGTPPLFLALMQHNRGIAEALIAAGADAKATDAAGFTTLMWAAYDDGADCVMIEKLLQLGVDPNAKNKQGDTALAIALRRGYTPAIQILRKAGASDTEMIRQSVEKAVALLQKSGPEFVKVSGCTSCHNQSLPQMAYSMARQRGFAVDAKISDQQVKAVMGMFRPETANMAAAKPNFPDPAISVSYALMGLSAEGYAPDATTAAMANLVSHQQTPEGNFMAFPARPPIESSEITATALSVRVLQVYGKDADEQVRRARVWLESAAKPRSMEDRSMRLLGLTWSGAAREQLHKAARDVLEQQRQDGGWAQLPAVESDAYATGQALVALRLSGEAQQDDAAYLRGIAFLLRTQLDDGSWFVRSRSFPFQTYRESGFPHGRHQWISAAGTSWAVMALTLTRPEPHLPSITAAVAIP